MAATKRKDWNELLGGKGKTSPDGSGSAGSDDTSQPPVTVLMHTIVGNPDNPRPEEDYSDADPEFAELKASMKEIGQLQPLAVVSRAVFEKAKPEAVAQASLKARKLLREADWVVVTGNRRLAAGRQLGWTRIDIRVQDQLGDEEGRIDEAVIIENIHRKNLSKIAEAEYLKVMLERHGTQEEVARRIGKSQVFVSQRLALLKLAPDIQDEVDAGTLDVKAARQLAGKTTDHDEQRAQVAALKEQKAAEPKPVRGRSSSPVQNPVLEPAPPPVSEQVASPVQNPVLNPAAPSVPETDREQVPDPREPEKPAASVPPPAVEGARKPVMFPYGDGLAAAHFLIERMPAPEFRRMLERLMEHHLEMVDTAPRT